MHENNAHIALLKICEKNERNKKFLTLHQNRQPKKQSREANPIHIMVDIPNAKAWIKAEPWQLLYRCSHQLHVFRTYTVHDFHESVLPVSFFSLFIM